MALTVNDLVCVNNVGPFRKWHYRTADAIATVTGANYFDSVYDRLAAGDVIVVVGSYGGTETVDMLVVDASASTGVTVVNGT